VTSPYGTINRSSSSSSSSSSSNRIPHTPHHTHPPPSPPGKPNNQNHAIIFTRGEAIQAVDMNQDNYLEEALKIPNLLEEMGFDLPRRPDGQHARYGRILGRVMILTNLLLLLPTTLTTTTYYYYYYYYYYYCCYLLLPPFGKDKLLSPIIEDPSNIYKTPPN